MSFGRKGGSSSKRNGGLFGNSNGTGSYGALDSDDEKATTPTRRSAQPLIIESTTHTNGNGVGSPPSSYKHSSRVPESSYSSLNLSSPIVTVDTDDKNETANVNNQKDDNALTTKTKVVIAKCANALIKFNQQVNNHIRAKNLHAAQSLLEALNKPEGFTLSTILKQQVLDEKGNEIQVLKYFPDAEKQFNILKLHVEQNIAVSGNNLGRTNGDSYNSPLGSMPTVDEITQTIKTQAEANLLLEEVNGTIINYTLKLNELSIHIKKLLSTDPTAAVDILENEANEQHFGYFPNAKKHFEILRKFAKAPGNAHDSKVEMELPRIDSSIYAYTSTFKTTANGLVTSASQSKEEFNVTVEAKKLAIFMDVLQLDHAEPNDFVDTYFTANPYFNGCADLLTMDIIEAKKKLAHAEMILKAQKDALNKLTQKEDKSAIVAFDIYHESTALLEEELAANAGEGDREKLETQLIPAQEKKVRDLVAKLETLSAFLIAIAKDEVEKKKSASEKAAEEIYKDLKKSNKAVSITELNLKNAKTLLKNAKALKQKQVFEAEQTIKTIKEAEKAKVRSPSALADAYLKLDGLETQIHASKAKIRVLANRAKELKSERDVLKKANRDLQHKLTSHTKLVWWWNYITNMLSLAGDGFFSAYEFTNIVDSTQKFFTAWDLTPPSDGVNSAIGGVLVTGDTFWNFLLFTPRNDATDVTIAYYEKYKLAAFYVAMYRYSLETGIYTKDKPVEAIFDFLHWMAKKTHNFVGGAADLIPFFDDWYEKNPGGTLALSALILLLANGYYSITTDNKYDRGRKAVPAQLVSLAKKMVSGDMARALDVTFEGIISASFVRAFSFYFITDATRKFGKNAALIAATTWVPAAVTAIIFGHTLYSRFSATYNASFSHQEKIVAEFAREAVLKEYNELLLSDDFRNMESTALMKTAFYKAAGVNPSAYILSRYTEEQTLALAKKQLLEKVTSPAKAFIEERTNQIYATSKWHDASLKDLLVSGLTGGFFGLLSDFIIRQLLAEALMDVGLAGAAIAIFSRAVSDLTLFYGAYSVTSNAASKNTAEKQIIDEMLETLVDAPDLPRLKFETPEDAWANLMEEWKLFNYKKADFFPDPNIVPTLNDELTDIVISQSGYEEEEKASLLNEIRVVQPVVVHTPTINSEIIEGYSPRAIWARIKTKVKDKLPEDYPEATAIVVNAWSALSRTIFQLYPTVTGILPLVGFIEEKVIVTLILLMLTRQGVNQVATFVDNVHNSIESHIHETTEDDIPNAREFLDKTDKWFQKQPWFNSCRSFVGSLSIRSGRGPLDESLLGQADHSDAPQTPPRGMQLNSK